jgi:PAS domain S-box-containing protein
MSKPKPKKDDQPVFDSHPSPETEGILELIFSSIHTGIAYLDPRFNFIWVNQGYATATGHEIGFFHEKNYFELFPDPDVQANFRKVVESGGTFSSFNKPGPALNGAAAGETYWDWRVQTLRDREETVKGLVLLVEDVTQRAKAEKALHRTQTMFAHLFESAPDANILVDEHGHIVALNRQAETLFGYARQELDGKPVETLVPDHSKRAHLRQRQKYQQDPHLRQMGANLDLYGRKKDGTEFPVDVTLSPLETEQGLLVLSVVRDITRRKAAQEALRKSEERLQAVIKTLPVILWAVDREGVFTLLEGRGLSSIHSRREDLLGHSAWETLAKTPQVLDNIRRALKGEEVIVDLDTVTGQSFEVSYSPQFDSNGGIVGVIGLASNITARKQAERELKHSEERFRTSVENLLEAFAILSAVRDLEGEVVDFQFEYANQAALLVNQDLEEPMLGKHLSDLLPNSKPAGLFKALCQVVETGQPLVLKSIEYEDRWGGQVPFQRALDIQATKLGDGVAASWRDVTEDRRMEAALRQQEALLRTVVDTLPVGVWVVDRDSQVVLGNQAGYQIWGGRLHSAQEQTGGLRAWWRRSGGRISPQEWPVARALAQAENLLEEEIDIETPDGQRKTILSSTAPLKGEGGQVTGAVMVFQEITERKRMEAELSEVQQRLMDGIELERRRLAQELHDGPIQDLYGLSFQLQGLDEEITSPAGKASVEEARVETQAVVQVLREICGELRPPTLVHFGLKKAILSHIEKVGKDHAEIKIELRLAEDGTELPEPIRLALFRIYQHSLSNILRHAHADRVEIHLDLVDRRVILEIHDNGVGFEVPHRWVKLAREGHLGLIGSSERAESVGGTLEIESAPGKGATIRAVVPIPHDNTVTAESAKQTA